MATPTKVDTTTFQIFGRTVGRNDILSRYWELATLDTEQTKGSLTGQLKALDSLCAQLNLTATSDDSDEIPDFFRAEWLPKLNEEE